VKIGHDDVTLTTTTGASGRGTCVRISFFEEETVLTGIFQLLNGRSCVRLSVLGDPHV